MGPGMDHARTIWSSTHKLQDPWLQAGDAKVSMDRKIDIRRDMHDAEWKLSTFGTRQNAASTRNTQKVANNSICPYLLLNLGMQALAKTAWPRVIWRASAWHPTKNVARKTDIMECEKVVDTARLQKGKIDAQNRARDREQIPDGSKQREKNYSIDGRPHGHSGQTHRKTQVNMGRSTSYKILVLEMGSRD